MKYKLLKSNSNFKTFLLWNKWNINFETRKKSHDKNGLLVVSQSLLCLGKLKMMYINDYWTFIIIFLLMKFCVGFAA